MIAAPGQLSAAQINTALHSMGQMPKLDIYAISCYRSAAQAIFFEKCFNELGLPHRFVFLEKDKGSRSSTPEFLVQQPGFGGAYMSPPIAAATTATFVPELSDAATAIGQVDTLHFLTGRCNAMSSCDHQHTGLHSDQSQTLIGDNAAWKGIRATLTSDFVPAAYTGRAALILAGAESDASAAIFALKSLGIGPIYTVGFKMALNSPLAGAVSPIRSIEDVKRLEHPFVIVSALPAHRSLLVGPLLKHYSTDRKGPGATAGKVFVDLASDDDEGVRSPSASPGPGATGTGGAVAPSPVATAAALGWTAYDRAHVRAWTQVETLRLLVGQNVPYDFVRLTSG